MQRDAVTKTVNRWVKFEYIAGGIFDDEIADYEYAHLQSILQLIFLHQWELLVVQNYILLKCDFCFKFSYRKYCNNFYTLHILLTSFLLILISNIDIS